MGGAVEWNYFCRPSPFADGLHSINGPWLDVEPFVCQEWKFANDHFDTCHVELSDIFGKLAWTVDRRSIGRGWGGDDDDERGTK